MLNEVVVDSDNGVAHDYTSDAQALKVARYAGGRNATICNFMLQKLQRLPRRPRAAHFFAECSLQRGANEVDEHADLRRNESRGSVQ